MALPAVAQDTEDGDSQTIGSGRLRASARAVAYYTDNFYNQAEGGAAGFGTLLAPELAYVRQTSVVQLVTAIGGEYGMFDLPGSQDDYLDGAVRLALASQLTLRNQVRLDGQYKHGHDPFGVDRTEDATVRDDELDQWDQSSGALHYRYGAPGAMLNAELGIGGLSKEYTTNTASTEPLSYDSTTFDYTVFYNYSSKTSAVVDFSRTDYSFDQAFAGTGSDFRGGELYRVRGGVKWLATGKTSGDVRVGYRRRLFDAGTPDLEGVDWEAGIDWAPAPRAMVRLQTARTEQESYTSSARLIDVQSLLANVKYNVSARLRATAQAEFLRADFDGSTRDDEITTLGVGAEYRALSYVAVVGNLSATQRDSTVAAREYDRLSGFVGVRIGR